MTEHEQFLRKCPDKRFPASVHLPWPYPDTMSSLWHCLWTPCTWSCLPLSIWSFLGCRPVSYDSARVSERDRCWHNQAGPELVLAELTPVDFPPESQSFLFPTDCARAQAVIPNPSSRPTAALALVLTNFRKTFNRTLSDLCRSGEKIERASKKRDVAKRKQGDMTKNSWSTWDVEKCRTLQFLGKCLDWTSERKQGKGLQEQTPEEGRGLITSSGARWLCAESLRPNTQAEKDPRNNPAQDLGLPGEKPQEDNVLGWWACHPPGSGFMVLSGGT